VRRGQRIPPRAILRGTMPEESTRPDLVGLARLAMAAVNRWKFGAYGSPDIVLDEARAAAARLAEERG
jgi:hypothetical protein